MTIISISILLISALDIDKKDTTFNFNFDSNKIKTLSNIIHLSKDTNNQVETLLAYHIVESDLRYPELAESITSPKIKEEVKKYITSSVENKETEKNKKYIRIVSIVSIIVGLLLSLYIYAKQNIKFYGTKSFLLLTQKAEKQYMQFHDSKSRLEYYSFTLIAISIVCSVVANFIYQFFISS